VSRSRRLRLIARLLQGALHLIESLLSFGGCFDRSSLLGGQWARDGFHQFMLSMEYVG
jgi:hypothetical protein